MTSPTPSQRPLANGSAISASTSTPRTRDWGRTGESGSAFRGLGRGRSNGPRGGGRGGRGGRGGGRGRGGTDFVNDKSSTINEAASPITKSAPPVVPSTSTNHSSTATSTTPAKPKVVPRRSSRSVPSLVVDPSTPTSEDPPVTTSNRPPNRRRRSQPTPKPPTQKAPVNATPKVGIPPLDENLLLPQKSRNNLHTLHAPKDTPPHLTTSFDIRTNIDALVERVRAVAMADNRPSTPGSHIDWAGDDDDSLPDLDDWGVTTGTSVGDKDEAISPIIVEGLKSLPEPTAPSLYEVEDAPLLPVIYDSKETTYQINEATPIPTIPASSHTQSSSPPLEHQKSKEISHDPRPPRGHSQERDKSLASHLPNSPGKSIHCNNTSVRRVVNEEKQEIKAPLHPSLPRKPVAAIESQGNTAKSRYIATPMQTNILRYPPVAEREVERSTPKPVELVLTASVQQPDLVETVIEKPAAIDSVDQSIHAPPPLDHVQKEESFKEINKPRDGLAASIHAPQTHSGSSSAPSNIFDYSSIPNAPRSFNPTHIRAHTVGRPLTSQYPSVDSHRFSRSGSSTPRDSNSPNVHVRTHSTPPTGSMLNHRVHATRPVITGDAISRLARTIGNAGLSPARTASVSASKDS